MAANVPLLSTKWPNKEAYVAIVLGSKNDYSKIEKLIEMMEKFSIPYVIVVISAHRNKQKLDEFIQGLSATNVRFVVAVAGMAAALGGAIAAETCLPVFGIPLPSPNDPDGIGAKFATNELPPGIAQVAVLADNVSDNSTRIVNLIARTLAILDPNYKGLKEFMASASVEKPPVIPYVPKEAS